MLPKNRSNCLWVNNTESYMKVTLIRYCLHIQLLLHVIYSCHSQYVLLGDSTQCQNTQCCWLFLLMVLQNKYGLATANRYTDTLLWASNQPWCHKIGKNQSKPTANQNSVWAGSQRVILTAIPRKWIVYIIKFTNITPFKHYLNT